MKRFTAILASLIIASSVLSFTVFAEPDSITGEDPYVQENIQYDANGNAYIEDENGTITYYDLNSYGYFVPVENPYSTEPEPSQEPSSEPSTEPSTEPSSEPSSEPSKEPSSESDTTSSKEPSKEPSESSNETFKPSSKDKNSEIPLINYKITPLKMNIALPNDVYVILRNGEQNEAALKIFNMTEKEAVESLRKSNMYLKGSPEDFSYDITVTMTEDDDSKTINNFTELDDKDLIEITNSLTAQEAYTSCTQKKYGDILYLSLNYHSTDNENDISGIQNYTIINGQKITITLQTRGKALTDEQTAILEAVMKSVSFTDIKPPAVQEDNSDQIRELKIITVATAAVCVVLFIVLIATLAKRAKRKKLISETSGENNSQFEKKHPKPVIASEPQKKREISESKPEETQAFDKHTVEEKEEPKETNTYTEADFELFETQPLTEKAEIYNSEKTPKSSKSTNLPEAPRYTPPGSVEFMTADINAPVTLTPTEAGIHLTTETITVPEESFSATDDIPHEKAESIHEDNEENSFDSKSNLSIDEHPISSEVEKEQPLETKPTLELSNEQLITEQTEDEQIIQKQTILENKEAEKPLEGQITFEKPAYDTPDNESKEAPVHNEGHETKESSLKSFLGKIKRVVVPEIDEDAFESEAENKDTSDEAFSETTSKETENPAKNVDNVQTVAPVMPKAVTMPAAPASTPVIPKKVSENDEQPVSRYEKLFGKNVRSVNSDNTTETSSTATTEKTESRFEKLFGVKNESTQASQNETFSDIYAAIDEVDTASTNNSQKKKSDESIVFEKPVQGDEDNIHDREPGSSIPKLNDTPVNESIPKSSSKAPETESRFEKLFGKNAPESISYSQSQAQRSSESSAEKNPSIQDSSEIKLEKIHTEKGKGSKKQKRRKK